ncbi:MAG: hypothetical protein RL001_1216 [Pseudomonadota bacterium]|jgi:DUF971 family protein|nr:DUF971 domain-containing protein [Oxalobacteraceae bacterium]
MNADYVPTAITVHKASRTLELAYGEHSYQLPFEFLRVYSPSAEVRGHGPGQEVLQTGKRKVEIKAIEPVGHYAIRPLFSDGHDSGIYSWDLLHSFCLNQQGMWEDYLRKLEAAGYTRESGRDIVSGSAQAHGCAG